MKNNIYLKSLEIGYNNLNGISFNDLKKQLNNPVLKDYNFHFYFMLWFYNNFYNALTEGDIKENNLTPSRHSNIQNSTKNPLLKANDSKSFVRGDSVNKYIDYLELERTRKSASTARNFSIASIVIASLAVIVPFIPLNYFKPPPDVIITNNRYDTTKSKIKDSDSLKLTVENMNKHKSPRTNNLKKVSPKKDSNN